ncbi:MAG: hypothetical protein DWH82_07135 [Planctomycetota bacterium]|nr:MAG: hypothetical protein DWH82_07135 [Planctomycetota bacterium]
MAGREKGEFPAGGGYFDTARLDAKIIKRIPAPTGRQNPPVKAFFGCGTQGGTGKKGFEALTR